MAGGLFVDRDRPELTDVEIRDDILHEAYETGSLPTGVFSERQVRLIEDCRRDGVLVDDQGSLKLSDETRRSMERQQLELERAANARTIGLDEEVMVGTRATTIRAEHERQRGGEPTTAPTFRCYAGSDIDQGPTSPCFVTLWNKDGETVTFRISFEDFDHLRGQPQSRL